MNLVSVHITISVKPNCGVNIISIFDCSLFAYFSIKVEFDILPIFPGGMVAYGNPFPNAGGIVTTNSTIVTFSVLFISSDSTTNKG